jgi:hypothetical protein
MALDHRGRPLDSHNEAEPFINVRSGTVDAYDLAPDDGTHFAVRADKMTAQLFESSVAYSTATNTFGNLDDQNMINR